MRHLISSMLLIGLLLVGCGREKPVPPPVQGPAVLGDGVVIEDWKYLGPESAVVPSEAANVRTFGTDEYKAWVIWTNNGFDLVWGQVPCATQPVVVVRAGSIEFWPGKIVTADCEAMLVYHKLTVKMKTDIPPEQWRLTLYPPPSP